MSEQQTTNLYDVYLRGGVAGPVQVVAEECTTSAATASLIFKRASRIVAEFAQEDLLGWVEHSR